MKRKIFGILLAMVLIVTNALPIFALESRQSLTPLQVENLAVLCKTWGFVKFYHPDCLNDSEKMDKELLSLIPLIENAKSSEERDAILSNWIKSLPEIVQKTEPKKAPEYTLTYTRPYDSEWITTLSDDLKSQLNVILNADRTGIKKLSYLNEYGFHNFDHELQYLDLKTIDKNHRLLALFRFWNIFEFFSPNKDLLDENWDMVLIDLIPTFHSAESTLEYQAALTKMARKTNDSHANVTGVQDYFTNAFGSYVIPANLVLIEGKVVVSDIITDNNSLVKGDIITAINGIPMKTLLDKVEFYSYSNDTGRLRDAVYINTLSHEKTNQVTINRNGKLLELSIDYLNKDHIPTTTTDEKIEPIKEIEKDVYYVNYGYLTPELEVELKEILKTAKTIIMDLRVYPKQHMSIYSSLDDFLPYQKLIHEYEMIDFFNPGNLFVFNDQSLVENNPDFYKGEFICLVDDKTLSHTEFTATRYRKAPKAIVLGSQTAGADGNVVFVPLVGPYKILYSSIGIHDIDGTETQRIGVKIDVPQIQTYKGFMDNEDDLLNAALAYAKKLNNHKVETRKINGVEMVSLKQALMYRPYEFQYDSATKTFTLKNGAESTTITLGSNAYKRFDGASIALESAPVVLNGRLYVPKEYLMDVLSLKLTIK